MRPGITGLWQVRRTRRSGLDFQEWIKYDIEYIENAGWRMDLTILWETIWEVLKVEKRK
jgi:lipopolysaccharide/colanic/teichoic acid biosynthesis glycosyltransferase